MPTMAMGMVAVSIVASKDSELTKTMRVDTKIGPCHYMGWTGTGLRSPREDIVANATIGVDLILPLVQRDSFVSISRCGISGFPIRKTNSALRTSADFALQRAAFSCSTTVHISEKRPPHSHHPSNHCCNGRRTLWMQSAGQHDTSTIQCSDSYLLLRFQPERRCSIASTTISGLNCTAAAIPSCRCHFIRRQ